jgi:hypothetical protein
MKSHTITFSPTGTALTLWTDAIPLQKLGELTITRASTIEFNQADQRWEVRDAENNLLFTHFSRSACLDWEHQHFNR